jgi:hypothetical protein
VGPARANARLRTETGLARRIELVTFCIAFARGQQFERSRILCKYLLTSSRTYGRFAAGPVSVRRGADAPARLHTKKTCKSGLSIPCKRAGSLVGVPFCDAPAFTASPREFGHPMGTEAPEPPAARAARRLSTSWLCAPSPPPGVRRDRQGDHRGPQQRLPCRVDSRAVGAAARALGCGRLARRRVHEDLLSEPGGLGVV